jgi:hypothetical protein
VRKPARSAVLVVAVAVLLVVLALLGLTLRGLQPQHQPDRAKFCFAEWCVTPVAIQPGGTESVVQLRVSSEARAVTQRPDHAQAWLSGADGRETGGPQPGLQRAIGPGAAYLATLRFPVAATAACLTLTVSEGAWPPFLGLGYAPSPFTERVDWRLCIAAV